MDIRKLQKAIVGGLEDVKAQDIVVFNTEALSPLFERVIIASGTSNRQTKALAASVRDAVKGIGEPVPRLEGEDNGEWIIVDCGAAVAHIMQPAIRDYYRLEEIWGMKPVALKAAVKKARAGLPKAEEPAAAPKKTPARKAPARKAAPRSTAPGSPARKSAAVKKAAAPSAPRRAAADAAPKAPARKAPARKSAPGKTAPRTASRAAAGKTAPARKAPSRAPARVSKPSKS